MEFKIDDFQNYDYVWKNNGFTIEGEYVKINDALSVTSAPRWLPKVITNIVKEAAEPMLVGTSLLQRINYSGYGQTITFGSIGALTAEDIAEGQEYPEVRLDMGAGTVTATIGKSGLAVKVTEEMLRYSQYDVIGMHLRAAGRALARHKEQKIFNYIANMGQITHDNATPSTSLYGTTSGRGFSGAANGSIIFDDILDMFATVVNNGFMPNTLLLHPLTWAIWVKDPILRAFALNAGGGVFYASWTGNPAGRAPWDNSSQGGLGVSGGQNIIPGGAISGAPASPLTQYSQNITSSPNIPSYFPIPFTIIVSPFVTYNPSTKLTDIYMFDRNELGAYIVDEDITSEEFDDPRVDIKKIKLRERYAFAILNEGLAIAVAKNIKVTPNEIVLPAQSTIDVNSTALDEIIHSNAVV